MSIAMLHALEAMPLNASTGQVEGLVSHEAARYAVLRRIGAAMRHQIAGALQPVSMMASMVERRAQAQSPNIDALKRNSSELSGLARAASSECVALMSWLAPHEGEQTPLNKGVEDCLHLLATELSFRGFSIADTTQGAEFLVGRHTLRTMLPASLMALTDASPTPAQVRVAANAHDRMVTLSLTLLPAPAQEGDEAPAPTRAYRALEWRDVQALARAEGVHVQVSGLTVQIDLPVLEGLPASDAGPPSG